MAPPQWLGATKLSTEDTTTNKESRGGLFRAIKMKATLKKTVPKDPSSTSDIQSAQVRKHNFVELGTIDYVNLTPDCRHGDLAVALKIAAETGKPIFANFAEWSGWQGCKDAGRVIFADPVVKKLAEEYFVPCAFNTLDRSDRSRNAPFRKWSAGLAHSWWGYLRIISSDGRAVLAGTRQITGGRALNEVKEVMMEALEMLDISIPDGFGI